MATGSKSNRGAKGRGHRTKGITGAPWARVINMSICTKSAEVEFLKSEKSTLILVTYSKNLRN